MLNTCSLRKEWREKRRLLGLNPPMPKEDCLEDSEMAAFKGIARFIVLAMVILISGCLAPKQAHAYSDEQIVNAIYKAEGGSKTKYPYGIRSVNCETTQACKAICFNTVKANRKRFARYGYRCFGRFIEFLASRYCPTTGRNLTANEKRLNGNWINNVEYFLAKKVA